MSDAPRHGHGRQPGKSFDNELRTNRDARLAWFVTIIAFLAATACILASPNGLHHFDDITHFLFARWAWHWPSYLLDHWGRPGFTVLYFPLAALGWTADKLLSAALSAAAGWFAFRIAQHANIRNAWMAALLCWAQPLYFQLAQTTLTETPLAFYLTAAVLLAIRGRWEWSSAMLSLGFVTRHEAVLFLPIWAYFAWRAKVSLIRLWPLVWAPAVVNVAAWMAGMTTAIELYLRPKPSNQYGSDGWTTFFARSMHAWGPGVAALAFAGMVDMGMQKWWKANGDVDDQTANSGGFANDKGAPPRALACACIIAYFAAQTAIRALGLFDSGGYARFLVPISPLVGVLALAGWNGLVSSATRRRMGHTILVVTSMALLWLALEEQILLHKGMDIEFPKLKEAQIAIRIIAGIVAAMAVIACFLRNSPSKLGRIIMPGGMAALMLFTAYVFHRPLHPPAEAPLIADAMDELSTQGLADRQVVSALLWIDYVKDSALPPKRRSTRERIADSPIGTIVAWERQFAGSHDHQLRLEEFIDNASFRLILQTRPKQYQNEPYLSLFEKVGPWPQEKRSRQP